MGERVAVRLGDVADVSWGDTTTTKASYVARGKRAFSASGPDGFLDHADYSEPGIVVSAIGAQCGRSWLARGEWSCIKNTIRILSRDPRLDIEYLYWLLQEENRWPQRGSAQPFISQTDARDLRVRLPPLSEQRAIAEVLGALDDKIEANRTMGTVLVRLIRATWSRMFESGDEGWPVMPIGEVVSVVGGSTPSTNVEEFWRGTVAWATPRDLSRLSFPPLMTTERHITERGLQQISSGLLPVGTVLLSSRAPIGYLAIAEIPVAINQGFIALPPTGKLPSLYMWQWLHNNLDAIKERSNGTTFMEVSKASFRPMPIGIPPPHLVENWMTFADPAYRRLVAAEKETRVLASLRDSLLPKLLSGELRVRQAEESVVEMV